MSSQGFDTICPYANIQRLPPELLAEIFAALAPARHPRWPRETSLDCPRLISHVSSRWRNIALNLSRLWTSIPVANEFWAALSLDRSRPLPISVSVTLDIGHVDDKYGDIVPIYDLHDGIQKALSEPHRLCAFEAEVASSEFGQTGIWLVDKLFSFVEAAETPLLEFLSIDIQFHDLNSAYQSFLGGVIPMTLRHIAVNGVYEYNLPYRYLLATPLTTLDLGSGDVWDSMEDALLSLSRLPMLETLSVRRDRDDLCYPSALPSSNILDIDTKNRPIVLPNLKKLYLYDRLELIACLMRNLRFPASSIIDFHDANDEAGVEATASARQCLEVLIAALNDHFAHLVTEGCTFRSLFLDTTTRGRREHTHRVQVVADFAMRDQDLLAPRSHLLADRMRRNDFFSHSPQDRSLSISVCNDMELSATELFDAITGLPILRQARALVFNESSYYGAREFFSATGSHEWKNTMRHLDTVRVAHLGGYIAVHQLAALLTTKPSVHALGLALTELVIEDVSFRPVKKPSRHDEEIRPARMSLDEFALVMQQCISRGGPACLTHVELVYCDIDEVQVTRLRRELGSDFVSWDGRTRGSRRSRARERWCGASDSSDSD